MAARVTPGSTPLGRSRRFGVAMALIALCGAAATAAAEDVRVTLDSRDALLGTLVRQDAQVVVIDHAVLGRLTIDRARVLDVADTASASESRLTVASATAGSIGVGPAGTILALSFGQPEAAETAGGDEAAAEAIDPGPASFWDGWEGRADFGLSGSEGNTTTLNLRAELGLERNTEKTETSFAALYRYTRDDNENTENRFQFDGRNDWLVPNERWRYFVRGRFEFDEFQAWDTRFSAFGGVGYDFIDTEKTTLTGLAGIGGNYTYGGTTYDLTPELLFALDFSHKLTEKSSITVYTEFLPSLLDLSEFRWNTKAAYEVMLDDELNMVLRAGIENRYDSDVDEGTKHNDLDYFITLGFRF